MADHGENMFGRDSDSDSSEEAVAVPSTENMPSPEAGVAAGGFLGQVQDVVAKEEAGSERGGGGGGGGGGALVAGGEDRDATPSSEVKAWEVEDVPPPPPSQGGAQPKKTLPRPVYEGNAAALLEMLLEARREGEEPDIAKVRELLDAGIDVRYQVRARYKRIMRNAKRRDKRGLKLTTTALSLASQYGQTDVVRELIAADGSMEHLRMKNKHGKTARDLAKTDEIKALLTAAEAAESS